MVIALAVLAICLSPRIEKGTKAIPENLWTSPGHWSKPSVSHEIEEWTRREYGRPWSWLVIDTGISVEARYARLDSKYLILYMMLALVVGTITWKLTKRHAVPNNEMQVTN